MKSPILLFAAILTLTGCTTGPKPAPLPPEFYEAGTKTAVKFGLRNSPNTARYLRAVQPVVCAAVTGGELTPQQISDSLTNVIDGKTPEGILIVGGVQLLYITAYNYIGGATNQATFRPYADAILCKGFAEGLAEGVIMRNAPVRSAWSSMIQ